MKLRRSLVGLVLLSGAGAASCTLPAPGGEGDSGTSSGRSVGFSGSPSSSSGSGSDTSSGSTWQGSSGGSSGASSGGSSGGPSSGSAADAAGPPVTDGNCETIAAGQAGGFQFARFAKTHIAGKSSVVQIAMGSWQCATAATSWTSTDTSAPCVDGNNQSHTLMLRSASFNAVCGNMNSCAWMNLSDTQALPPFTGSDLGVNGYWNLANYSNSQFFRVGVIDEYTDDSFTGTEEAQDLYLSSSFTVCSQPQPSVVPVDAAAPSVADAGAEAGPPATSQCASIAADQSGGFQFARFAKSHIAGTSSVVRITMDNWQCATAATSWASVDTSVPCVDNNNHSHTLMLRSASFNTKCGNTNSCAWISLSDTQTLPSFGGSDLGVNGYWSVANYSGTAQLFRVGVIDEYTDDLFTGMEEAQDLYLSKNFTVCAGPQ